MPEPLAWIDDELQSLKKLVCITPFAHWTPPKGLGWSWMGKRYSTFARIII